MSASRTKASNYDAPGEVEDLVALAPAVVEMVRSWLAESGSTRVDRSADRLARVLADPDGLRFAVSFIDGVIRPEDPKTAIRRFAELSVRPPDFLPRYLRRGIRLGGLFGPAVPRLSVAVVRRVLRALVGHLVVDAGDAQLGAAIRRLRRPDVRLNVNLLGEAVLGQAEASRHLANIERLLLRDDVDYVSVKVSNALAPRNPWAFDDTVEGIARAVTPLFRRAAESRPPKFVNLDMEEYRNLALTIAVFREVLERPEFLEVEAGVVIQAYLPDALTKMIELQEWSAARRARGGAPIKVRLVKGANLPMERVEAQLQNWPLATWHDKRETDTHYKRVLDYALTPERIANVRIGIAGHNLFDVAFGWLLAGERQVREGVWFEMLLGMAPGQVDAIRRTTGSVLLYTPVVAREEFDVAIAYLVRRLDEGASPQNFLSAAFGLHADESLFQREQQRFERSLAALDRSIPAAHRGRDRSAPGTAFFAGGDPAAFRNVADSDPSCPSNQSWMATIRDRVPASELGREELARATVTSAAALDERVARAVQAGRSWGTRAAADRAAILRRVASELERRRADLIEVMAAECGKTVDQGDPEVSEAVDFARYYADLAEGLDRIDGARPAPVPLVVVTPPWNFPVSITAGSTLAGLAAGSAVLLKPAPQAGRCGAVLAQCIWAAGVPSGVLQLLDIDEGDLGRRLIADPRVGRVVLTGSYETADLFRGFRLDVSLLAETSGKNAIVVTPSADINLAVKDIVSSAFGHAGQKCSAASLLILVGSVARSTRFRHQLLDAIASLPVGLPTTPAVRMGPLVEPARGKLHRALTSLEPGERWLVEPRQLDPEGLLWSPGVKDGVRAGSFTHLTEFFGPILGVLTARSLDEAIELQNAVPYGLTAGLFSLDRDEVETWLDRVEAGNLYVNRGITGAIVCRQPFGGWKRSSVGTGTKAGGPNYLIGLTDWVSAPARADDRFTDVGVAFYRAAQSDGLSGLDGLARALRSDAEVWRKEFEPVRDVAGLAAERNLSRYRPHPRVVVRFASGPVAHLVRVVAAGVQAGGSVLVSTALDPPPGVRAELSAAVVDLAVEDDEAWSRRLNGLESTRIRLIGGDVVQTYRVLGPRSDVAVYPGPVTESGRLEMLPFLREQSISLTAHRFGTPDPLVEGLRLEADAEAAAATGRGGVPVS